MPEYLPRNILVTGGAGFIGCNFIRHLLTESTLRAELTVVNLDALTYAADPESLSDLDATGRYRLVQGDICDRALVDRLLREHEIDTIAHFAAESHVDRSISGPTAFIQTNVVGTFTLLEAAREYWLGERKLGAGECRFHHVSTDEVYGSLGKEDPAFTEETPYSPNSPYSASKAGSDHLVRAYEHTFGLPVTATNCSNNYGPYQHAEKLIPTIINACLNGRPIPVYGDGSNIRDWLYVEDHCRGVEAVLRRGQVGRTYNLGGNNEWRNLDIVRLICRLMDERRPQHAPHDRLIAYVTDRPGHDWRYAVDTGRVRSELGWTPQESFQTGIEKTLDWYLAGSNNFAPSAAARAVAAG